MADAAYEVDVTAPSKALDAAAEGPELETEHDYAMALEALAKEQSRRRRPLEDRWLRDYLQHEGLDDAGRPNEESTPAGQAPAGASENDATGSRLVANLTRPLTRVMENRLKSTLFPSDQDNWDIKSTPVPELEAAAKVTSAQVEDDEADEAKLEVVKEAREQARMKTIAMREVMADQLRETDYPFQGGRVIHQGCKYGTGVLKGPVNNLKKKRRWVGNGKKAKIEWLKDPRPYLEWVDLWDFFPDMDADTIEDCDFIFQLHRMSARELRRLGRQGEDGFRKDAIRELLREPPDNASFEDTMRDLRKYEYEDTRSTGVDGNKRYYIWEYTGPIPVATFEALLRSDHREDLIDVFGRELDDPLEAIHGTVWVCQGKILKYGPAPLATGDHIYSLYHIESDTNSLFKKGIPAILRDPQAAFTAAWRAMLDNGSLAGVPMFEVDEDLQPLDRVKEIRAGKIWLRKASLGERSGIAAVEVVGNTEQLVEILNIARAMADEEAGVPPIAQGEAGDNQLGRTAQGMSQAASAVNVLFSGATRLFDDNVTKPTLRRLYDWNMQFSDDPAIKGDMEVIPRGSTVLLVRELLVQHLMMLLNLVGQVEAMGAMVKMERVLRELVRQWQLPLDEFIRTDEEMEEIQAEQDGQPDPELEGKRMLEEMKLQGQLQLAQIQFQTEVLKLAAQEKMSFEKIMADLETVRLTTGSKERQIAAEIAVKAREGSGI